METQKDKILKILEDGEWHNVIEFHPIAWRYGAILFNLRKEGYEFDKKKGLNGLDDWRIKETQMCLTANNKESIF